jgi:signal transduction histidine kinase
VSERESRRVAEARTRAEERLIRQRGALRPLGLALVAVVVAATFGGHPAPGSHGSGIGVLVALAGFAAMLVLAIGDSFPQRSALRQMATIAAMGAAAVALIALQPRGAAEVAGATAVWMAVVRLAPVPGLLIGVSTTAALGVAAALAGSSATTILALTLLCALLGLVARFMKQARESQDRTELLLAELEDAREEQTRAAAAAERARIAGELHDVLAHTLSGAAIQLQGARKLAEREQAQPQLRSAIDRASDLVKEGLGSARQAVGALRGEELPSVAELPSLIDSFRVDLGVDVTLTVEGDQRTLPADASLALYRGAQEALTNVARYAAGAIATVTLHYGAASTTLTVEDRAPAAAMAGDGLSGHGGGRGLAGMRDRVERAGGSMQAGATEHGWCVRLEVPG